MERRHAVALTVLVLALSLTDHLITARQSNHLNGHSLEFTAQTKAGSVIQDLFGRIQTEQVKEDVPLIPFIQFSRKKGVYNSAVKLNFVGHLEMTEARREFSVFDNNMFVTALVTSSLLEAFQYTGAPKPSDRQLQLAIEAISSNHDNNQGHATSVMNFWPQTYNKSTHYYESTPENLLECFKVTEYLPMKTIEEFLKLIGLKAIAKDVESILESKDTFIAAFHIPPDFDDTFVNLGLGALLYETQTQFHSAWNQWSRKNTNISSVFDALKKYKYRPFSSNPNENSIDPRSYFWLRGFLEDAKQQGDDVALVTTWVQNIDEARTIFYKGVSMPFQINNVDATVAANTVFGISSAVLSGLVLPTVLDDPVIEKIYHNTSAMLAYVIANNLTDREDLVLTYYPSRYNFYWFVARTLSVMDTARAKGPLPRSVMETIYQLLKSTLEGGMTKYILAHAKYGDNKDIYFDDFLGDGDVTLANMSVLYGEDRIFTSAMAVNALLYTWTSYNETTKNTHWKPGVPQGVKNTVFGAVQWLRANVLGGQFKPWNAFFSGSVKGFAELPFWYPANRFEFLNGTAIHNWTHIPNVPVVLALQGYMDPAQYAAQLKQRHFGMSTPLIFNGFNQMNGYFPFWFSVPYTYSTTLLALTRYNSLVD